MRRLFPLSAALLLLHLPAASLSAEPPPATREVIFYVSGLECGSCVYMVQQSLTETPGVVDAHVIQRIDSIARVVFDPKVLTEHQLAQAVRDSTALHGLPYLASLKFQIPAYADPANQARVDAVFARWKPWLEIEVEDKAKGAFILHFRPLPGAAKPAEDEPATPTPAPTPPPAPPARPAGWQLPELRTALAAPAPQGLGLEVILDIPEYP